MDNTVKNKYLAEKMGKCWHEWNEKDDDYSCVCGVLSGSAVVLRSHIDKSNPDYQTADGRQILLEWAVKEANRGWWSKFLYAYYNKISTLNSPRDEVDVISTLLIPVDALAEALYGYLKEKDNA